MSIWEGKKIIQDPMNDKTLMDAGSMSGSGWDTEKVSQICLDRAHKLAHRQSVATEKDETMFLLSFSLGEKEKYAVHLHHLSCVVKYRTVTPVPKAHPLVKGIMNLRGEICCVVDLSKILGISTASGEMDIPSGYILVLKENQIGLAVQNIHAINPIKKNDIFFEGSKNDIIGQYASGLILKEIIVLDMKKLMAHPIFVEKY